MELKVSFPGGKRVDAEYNGFTIKTDQPFPAGEGSAPTPFELFLGSLGTCAGIFVLGFCQSRNLPTEGIEIIQRMDYNPSEKLVKNIYFDIVVPPEFPEQYHSALVHSANHCLVKRHFENPPNIETKTIVRNA